MGKEGKRKNGKKKKRRAKNIYHGMKEKNIYLQKQGKFLCVHILNHSLKVVVAGDASEQAHICSELWRNGVRTSISATERFVEFLGGIEKHLSWPKGKVWHRLSTSCFSRISVLSLNFHYNNISIFARTPLSPKSIAGIIFKTNNQVMTDISIRMDELTELAKDVGAEIVIFATQEHAR